MRFPTAGRLDGVAKHAQDRPLGLATVFAPQHCGVRLVPLRPLEHHPIGRLLRCDASVCERVSSGDASLALPFHRMLTGPLPHTRVRAPRPQYPAAVSLTRRNAPGGAPGTRAEDGHAITTKPPPVKLLSRAVHCLRRGVGQDSAAGPIVRGLNDNIRKRPELIWRTHAPELFRRNVSGQVFHEDHVVRITHAPWRMGRDAR